MIMVSFKENLTCIVLSTEMLASPLNMLLDGSMFVDHSHRVLSVSVVCTSGRISTYQATTTLTTTKLMMMLELTMLTRRQ